MLTTISATGLYLLLLIGVTIVLFTIGYLLIKLRIGRIGFHTTLFISLLTGFITLVVVYSIAITGFKTITLAFVPIIGFLLLSLKSSNSPTANTEIIDSGKVGFSKIAGLLIVLLLLFTKEAVHIFRAAEFPYWLQDQDVTFYAHLADMLGRTGQENFYGENNLYHPDFHGMMPYHYLELWLTDLIGRASGFPRIIIFRAIIAPLFNFLFFIGILSVWEHFGKVTGKKYIFSLLLLGAGGLLIGISDGLPILTGVKYHAQLSLPIYLPYKVGVPALFLIAALLFHLKKNHQATWVILSCLPIVNPVFFPAVAGVTAVVLIFPKLRKRVRPIRIGGLAFTTIGLLFSLFYLFWGTNNGTGLYEQTVFYQIQNGNSFSYLLRKFVAVFLVQPAESILVFSPFLILIIAYYYKNLKKKHKPAVFIFIATVFAALTASFLLIGNRDAMQIYRLSINVTVTVLLIYLFIRIYSTFKKEAIRKTGFTLFVFLLFAGLNLIFALNKDKADRKAANHLHTDYLKMISTISKKFNKPIKGAFLIGFEEYTSPYSYNAVYHKLGAYTAFMKSFESPINIGLFDSKFREKTDSALLQETSCFYNYVYKNKNDDRSLEERQVAFIRQFNIQYLIVSKHAVIPAKIKALISEEVARDPSGEQFYLLNPGN